MSPDLCIVATGVANLASVRACLSRLGASFELSRDPAHIARASHVIIPGVGSLAAAIETMQKDKLASVVAQRLEEDRPTLGICLGMQLMGQGSQESPGTDGLGFLDRRAQIFAAPLVAPHMGWNHVQVPKTYRVIGSGYAYFAHSYYWDCDNKPEDWAVTNYGQSSFVAGFERGNIVGCQFHPELSGDYGKNVVRRFLSLESVC